MTTSMGIVLALIATTVVLFATEKIRVDLVALLVMSALILSGILTPEEGLAGFSNPATLTVAAMFVLSAGLYRTGAVSALGAALGRLSRRNSWLGLVVLMAAVGVISAFVNNTAAVAVFLPIVLGVARDTNTSPSRLLMPLSFASMLGGTCTLIGTSTNILVGSIAAKHGQPSFGMFEFSGLGLIMFLAGGAYMLTIGIRLIPDRRRSAELTGSFALKSYLTEVVLLPESPSAGKPLAEAPLIKDLDVEILDIHREGRRVSADGPSAILQAGDVLRILGDVEKVKSLREREGIDLRGDVAFGEKELSDEGFLLVEAAVAPNSRLLGRTLSGARLRENYGATALALRHRNDLLHARLYQTPLRAGDALLLRLRKENLDALRSGEDFVLVSELGVPEFRRKRLLFALAIVAAVVTTAALGLVPIVVGACAGAALMVLSRCLTMEEAYQAVEWKVVFLLAGVLTLGVALAKTGAAKLLAGLLVSTAGAWGPVALVSALYLMTSLLTEAMSNNATAALLTPIAIATADALGIDARPLLMAVTFAASASFMTPVGYQTNTLIYGPGQYRFSDFFRVGAPLNLLLWMIATFLIPVFWPFTR